MPLAAPVAASQSFPARLECAAGAGAWIRNQAEALLIDPDTRYALEVCLEEIFANLVLHGKASSATLRLARQGERAHLDITDDGARFDPRQAPDERVSGPLAQARIGGLGLGLVRRLAAAMRYERRAGLNHLVLEFALTSRQDNPAADA